jgi:hypothetical protein
MPNKTHDRSKHILLFLSTVISVVVSLIPMLGYVGIEQQLPSLKNVHWTILTASVLLIYLLSCFLVEKFAPEGSTFRKLFRIPAWTELQAFGDQPAAKFSFWALIVIPSFAYVVKTNYFSSLLPGYQFPFNLKLAYFASWFLALSLIIFSVSCPPIIRKKNPLDKVKTVNLVLNNVENPSVSIKTDEEPIDKTTDQSSLLLRTLSFSFFVFGILTFVIILFRSAAVVLNS